MAGPKTHIAGSVFAPTTAIDLNGNDNDGPVAGNSIIARQITLRRWVNAPSGSTLFGGDGTYGQSHRRVTLYVYRTDTGGDPLLLGTTDVDFDDNWGTADEAGANVWVERWTKP
jgi:hypothetical protein